MKKLYKCPQCATELKFDSAAVQKVKCPKCAYVGASGTFAEVPLKPMSCPQCNAAFSVRADNVPKVVTCPKCKHGNVVSAFEKSDTLPEAPKQTKSADIDATQVRDATSLPKGGLYCPGTLEFVSSDAQWESPKRSIILKRGKNTFGRMAAAVVANCQLPVADRYMSKSHATIDVVMKADCTFEHQLTDMRSTNGTFHNDTRLEEGDVIILTPGDMVRFGHTIFRFVETKL